MDTMVILWNTKGISFDVLIYNQLYATHKEKLVSKHQNIHPWWVYGGLIKENGDWMKFDGV